MGFLEFLIIIGLFILMMVLYRKADVWVKKMDPKTVKTLNWIGFIVGVVGGVGWYATNNNLFMFATFIGIILYFIFYKYDKMEEEAENKK